MKLSSRVDYAAGVKAGVVAELVSLAFSIPAYFVSLYFRDPMGTFRFPRLVLFIAETDVPYAIVLGLIIGIVFAATQDRFLRGTILELKGILYAMAYFLLVILPQILLRPLLTQFYFTSVDFPIAIAGYVILGVVLGNLYRRFSSRPRTIVPC